MRNFRIAASLAICVSLIPLGTDARPILRAPAPAARSAVGSPTLVYVASSTLNAITIYLSDGSGNVTSVGSIAGSRTGLTSPIGLTLDPQGTLYVVNSGSTSSVTVYAPGAHGNVAPIRTIAGPATHLRAVAYPPDHPTGAIAVDPVDGEIFVAHISAATPWPYDKAVLVFASTATGNVAPLGSIGGESGYRAGTSASSCCYGQTTTGGIVITSLSELTTVPVVIVATTTATVGNDNDGWFYYSQPDLTQIASLFYAVNSGVFGLAGSPVTGDVVALNGYPAEVNVWSPGTTADTQPLQTLLDPLNAGFTAVAVDQNDTRWLLSGSTAIEAFAPQSTTAWKTITGKQGLSGIAVLPLGALRIPAPRP